MLSTPTYTFLSLNTPRTHNHISLDQVTLMFQINKQPQSLLYFTTVSPQGSGLVNNHPGKYPRAAPSDICQEEFQKIITDPSHRDFTFKLHGWENNLKHAVALGCLKKKTQTPHVTMRKYDTAMTSPGTRKTWLWSKMNLGLRCSVYTGTRCSLSYVREDFSV